MNSPFESSPSLIRSRLSVWLFGVWFTCVFFCVLFFLVFFFFDKPNTCFTNIRLSLLASLKGSEIGLKPVLLSADLPFYSKITLWQPWEGIPVIWFWSLCQNVVLIINNKWTDLRAITICPSSIFLLLKCRHVRLLKTEKKRNKCNVQINCQRQQLSLQAEPHALHLFSDVCLKFQF